MRLEVVVAPCGQPLTVAMLTERVPGLGLGVAPALERSAVSFVGGVELESPEAEVARHVSALLRLSREFPSIEISVTAVPDGGALQIRNGELEPDEAARGSVLGKISSSLRWRVYVSFRIEADAHPHLIHLVTESIGGSFEPVIDSTPSALAIGFDFEGNATRVANLVGDLRLAWRQEGSESGCLIEIEGADPRLETLHTWTEWLELERAVRGPAPAPAASAEPPRTVKIADAPETLPLLGAARLSWLDADDQILSLHHGELLTTTERIELRHDGAEIRRSEDRLAFLVDDKRLDIPPPDVGAERRVHNVYRHGALISDSLGGATSAHTRLFLVHGKGINEGPVLGAVRSIDADHDTVFALAEGRGGLALHEIELGGRWDRSETRPWEHDERPCDVAVLEQRIAVTVQRDLRSNLYLLERANLVYRRTIAMPCVEPQIVGHRNDTLWVTGMSPPPGPRRCDLFRVDLRRGMVIVATAELADVVAIDVVLGAHTDDALIATPRGVYLATRLALREMLELASDETVTDMALGATSCVFVHGVHGARLVLGQQQATVPLRTPGYAPLIA
ncbi:MAG: hypothetical protein JWO36_1763 [Myxococcales bacterium]|nr:hypothetical protein [Myxococcales bacterium]